MVGFYVGVGLQLGRPVDIHHPPPDATIGCNRVIATGLGGFLEDA